MIVNSSGTIISGITNAAYSILGDEYLAMLDDSGVVIHIHRSVIDYLHSIPMRIPQIIDPKQVFV